MSAYKFVAVVALSTCLTGCLQSATLVKVKPDGSGTIEQTMLVNLQTIKGMMAGMGGGQMKESGRARMNEAEFKRTAERMGVKPVSLTPLKEGAFEGSKAIFAFDDITKVRVDQDPNMSGRRLGSRRRLATEPDHVRAVQAGRHLGADHHVRREAGRRRRREGRRRGRQPAGHRRRHGSRR